MDSSGQVLSRECAEHAWPWMTVQWQTQAPEHGTYLRWDPDQGLALQCVELGPRSRLHLDYQHGPQARRIKAVSGELLTRALGCQQRLRPAIVDGTFGLGHDSTVLANVGCHVLAFESHPVVAALAADALQRSREAVWAERLTLVHADALTVLSEVPAGVIYLDPMFQEARRAAPSLEMQFLHHLMPNASTGDALLDAALDSKAARIVVKRSPKAPPLAGRTPAATVQGKAVRFDLYPLRKLQPEDCEPWWQERH